MANPTGGEKPFEFNSQISHAMNASKADEQDQMTAEEEAKAWADLEAGDADEDRDPNFTVISVSTPRGSSTQMGSASLSSSSTAYLQSSADRVNSFVQHEQTPEDIALIEARVRASASISNVPSSSQLGRIGSASVVGTSSTSSLASSSLSSKQLTPTTSQSNVTVTKTASFRNKIAETFGRATRHQKHIVKAIAEKNNWTTIDVKKGVEISIAGKNSKGKTVFKETPSRKSVLLFLLREVPLTHEDEEGLTKAFAASQKITDDFTAECLKIPFMRKVFAGLDAWVNDGDTPKELLKAVKNNSVFDRSYHTTFLFDYQKYALTDKSYDDLSPKDQKAEWGKITHLLKYFKPREGKKETQINVQNVDNQFINLERCIKEKDATAFVEAKSILSKAYSELKTMVGNNFWNTPGQGDIRRIMLHFLEELRTPARPPEKPGKEDVMPGGPTTGKPKSVII